MKILLCHNHYQQRGGEDQVFDDEAWLLESRGHRVLKFTRHNDSVAELGRWQLARQTFWNRQVYQQLRALLRREQPDVMHCTNTFPLLSPAVYDAARDAGVPIVQSLHNYRLLCPNALFLRDGRVCEDCLGKSFAWPAIQHACYRDSRSATAVLAGMLTTHYLLGTWVNKVDRYIALSEFARAKLIQGGLPADKIAVKPNFAPMPPSPGTGAGQFVLFVGRLSPEKGISVLLEAWARLAEQVPLCIVGDGPQADAVRQAKRSDPRIEWLGRCDSQQTLSLMAEAAMLVIPSICYEACPKALIESLAAGTPVIASRLGSMIEMVDDGRIGWHFPASDAAGLAELVARVWLKRHHLAGVRRQARQRFEQHYTPERNYQQLMQIYQSVLSQPAAPSLDDAATSLVSTCSSP
jgi:glycosyltransferase involved in cell wall biosynthesis